MNTAYTKRELNILIAARNQSRRFISEVRNTPLLLDSGTPRGVIFVGLKELVAEVVQTFRNYENLFWDNTYQCTPSTDLLRRQMKARGIPMDKKQRYSLLCHLRKDMNLDRIEVLTYAGNKKEQIHFEIRKGIVKVTEFSEVGTNPHVSEVNVLVVNLLP